MNIYSSIDDINTALASVTGSDPLRKASGTDDLYYWSSSEMNADDAYVVNFKASESESDTVVKTEKALVRAFRIF
jgi:hypothetical protein